MKNRKDALMLQENTVKMSVCVICCVTCTVGKMQEFHKYNLLNFRNDTLKEHKQKVVDLSTKQ